ncbi:hypothetical protein PDIDSM_1311 [Penicillium digitatum]|nr:hypothetical protein PDIDSM_1311 [Penicillium digitatum]
MNQVFDEALKLTVSITSPKLVSDRGEGEIARPCITACALITSYFKSSESDDHDPQSLAGS